MSIEVYATLAYPVANRYPANPCIPHGRPGPENHRLARVQRAMERCRRCRRADVRAQLGASDRFVVVKDAAPVVPPAQPQCLPRIQYVSDTLTLPACVPACLPTRAGRCGLPGDASVAAAEAAAGPPRVAVTTQRRGCSVGVPPTCRCLDCKLKLRNGVRVPRRGTRGVGQECCTTLLEKRSPHADAGVWPRAPA